MLNWSFLNGTPLLDWDRQHLCKLFNDCDELYYFEAAISPDGRTATLLGRDETSEEPTRLLTDSERQVLEQILRSVKSQ